MAGAASACPTLARHIADALPTADFGAGVGVAVSGGGDSMALLDLVATQCDTQGMVCRAVTINHGLRPEAADEAALVAAFCAARGISHDVLTWSWNGRGNLQAAARDARYLLFSQWVASHGLGAVLLGHTADDVAESFLLRLRRSPGVDGLAAMPARFVKHNILCLRPLLQVGRMVLRDHLRARNIPWADDPTNEDCRYDRARARRIIQDIQPLGAGAAQVAASAAHLRDARDALEWAAVQARAVIASEDRGDVIVKRGVVPPELERRVLLAALTHISTPPTPPRAAALDKMQEALAAGASAHVLAGCRISPALGGALRIGREMARVEGLTAPSDTLWDGRWRLDGPHAPGIEIRALGSAIADCPWRDTGLPRASVMAGPAIWRGAELVAAPLAGWSQGWQASADGRGKFVQTSNGD